MSETSSLKLLQSDGQGRRALQWLEKYLSDVRRFLST